MFNFLKSWEIIFLCIAFINTTSAAPVSCDFAAAEKCLDDYLQELETIIYSDGSVEVIVTSICNVSYPAYQQCRQPNCPQPALLNNIWVKATEYLCARNETVQSEGINCLSKPNVSQGIVSCNAAIPFGLDGTDFCGVRDAYVACVDNIAESFCSAMGTFVVRDYLLYQFRHTSVVFMCDDDTATNTTMETTTTTTALPTTLPTTIATTLTMASAAPSFPEICGKECLENFSPLVFYEALVKKQFTFTMYTDACSNFSRYEQCMDQKYQDCNTSHVAAHDAIRYPFSYTCGEGKHDILSNKACWDKDEVKQVMTSCFLYAPTTTEEHPICRLMSCLNTGVGKHCDLQATSAAVNFINVTTFLAQGMDNSCIISQPEQPEPEPEGKPEGEPEVTANPGTPEPGPEGTVTTTPEAEVTLSTGSDGQCNVTAYGMCALELSQDIQTWVLTVTSNTTLTDSFHISTVETICSNYLNKFKPCASSTMSGCSRGVALTVDTLTASLDYLCTADRNVLINTLPCLSKPAIIEAIQFCNDGISQGSRTPCRIATNYVDCFSNVTSGLCTEAARSTLIDFLTASIQPFSDYYSCNDTTTSTASNTTSTTTSTTTSPSPAATQNVTDTVFTVNISCYECHSGGGSYQNEFCTPDGIIADWYVQTKSCQDSCFARTDRWNKGVVYRGCGHDHLPSDYPRPLPRSGCRVINKQTWCFCDSNKCNDMSMLDRFP